LTAFPKSKEGILKNIESLFFVPLFIFNDPLKK